MSESGRRLGLIALVALGVAGVLLVTSALLIYALTPIPTPASAGNLTVIAAPTDTPQPSATATLEGGAAAEATPIPGEFSIGAYVQISGTGGDGLRLRSGPGTSHEPIFLGMDSEVFKVVDGPTEADGFTWWFLEAPYDEKRSGWAASAYLTVIEPQNP